MGRGRDKGDFCAMCGAAGVCCCIVLVVLFFIGLGIAKIVMGAVYLHDCSIEHLIPIYLIVSGVAPILLGGFGRTNDEEGQRDGGSNRCGTICGTIGFLFNLSWLICGSVWVYPNYGQVITQGLPPCGGNVTTDCTNGTCNESLIKFAFGMVTFDWICTGLWIVMICCMICRACAKS